MTIVNKIRGRKSNRGISIIEYVILMVLVILALLAMRFYLKGAMCGRYRGVADFFGQGRQYEPGVTVIDPVVDPCAGAYCGDNICNYGCGENIHTCPEDCGI